MSRKIKVIIADDHELVRKGQMSLLAEDSKISIVGEVENGKQLIEMLKRVSADVILLDLEMPVMNGDEALSIISRRFPQVKVVIVSIHYTENLVADFLSRGAAAYLSKNASPETLADAIHTVHQKGNYFDQNTASAMLLGLKKEKSLFSVFDKLALTQREIEILKLVCNGKTNKEVSITLNITTRTVDFHRRNIYDKTQCRTLAELVLYAVRNGIIYPSEEFQSQRWR